jgi:hypothetical protein
MRRGSKRKPDTPPRDLDSERFRRKMNEDIEWLREKGLDPLADRAEQLLASEERGDRLLLWQVHRRVQQIQRLPESSQKKAIENERLRFEVHDLARQYRAAEEDQRDPIGEKLHQALEKQFDLRQESLKAIAEGLRQRFKTVDEKFGQSREHREELIDRLLEEMLDPERPLQEPQLLPGHPAHSGSSRRGRPGRPDRD